MENNKEILNCVNCLYANNNEDGSILCNKKIFMTGELFHVTSTKINLPYPSHSSKYIEEIRYMRNNKWLHESEEGEYCEVCRRWVDMGDETQYNFIEVQDEKGSSAGEKLQCRICRGKGRR